MKKIILASALLSMSLSAATVAVVNGQTIDEQDLIPVVQQVTRGQFDQLPPEVQERAKKAALDEIIGQLLLQEQADKEKVGNSTRYKEALKEYLKRFEPQLRARVWLEQEFEKVKVGSKEVKKFYDENKDKFNAPKEVHARHILLSKDDSTKADTLIAELQKLKGNALQNKFIELASKNSIGPTKDNGGDLGFFPQGAMVPEFDQAVFAMKVGTITPKAVKTKHGLHIIYVEDERGGDVKSFEQLKPQVENAYKAQKFQTILKDKVTALKAKAKISYK